MLLYFLTTSDFGLIFPAKHCLKVEEGCCRARVSIFKRLIFYPVNF